MVWMVISYLMSAKISVNIKLMKHVFVNVGSSVIKITSLYLIFLHIIAVHKSIMHNVNLLPN